MYTNRKPAQMNPFNKTLFALLIAGLAVMLFLFYTDSDSAFAFSFLTSYVLFLLLAVLYFLALILLHMRKLAGSEIRERLIKAAGYLLFILAFQFAMYLFGWLQVSWINIVIVSVSISFSLSFFDLVFTSRAKRDSC